MSEEVGAVVDPDIQPPPEAAIAEPEAAIAENLPPAEDEIPEAVEVQPGVRVVPVGVVKALRDEIKALKPQAQRTADLEREVGAHRAVVEFIRANPHLMQPPQVPQQAAPNPGDDPGLVELARTLDLYTGR